MSARVEIRDPVPDTAVVVCGDVVVTADVAVVVGGLGVAACCAQALPSRSGSSPCGSLAGPPWASKKACASSWDVKSRQGGGSDGVGGAV